MFIDINPDGVQTASAYMRNSMLRQQRGVGLIEVLVTVLILGTSLLAMAALQLRSLEQNHSAYLRTQANILAYDLIDRVRMTSPQPPAALIWPDQEEITAVVAAVLPDGVGEMDCAANRFCTLTITWYENAGTDEGGESSTFTYSTSL